MRSRRLLVSGADTGAYAPHLRSKAIAGYQKGKKPKIKNRQRFEEFVLKHNTKTQQRIAQLWGDSLTQQNVSDAMKKLGITRKKTYGYRERDEEKRRQYLERISQIEKSKIVYVDEAGGEASATGETLSYLIPRVNTNWLNLVYQQFSIDVGINNQKKIFW